VVIKFVKVLIHAQTNYSVVFISKQLSFLNLTAMHLTGSSLKKEGSSVVKGRMNDQSQPQSGGRLVGVGVNPRYLADNGQNRSAMTPQKR